MELKIKSRRQRFANRNQYLAKYSPIEMFALAFREGIRNHLGVCTVKGCNKPIWKEGLICAISIGNNDYYVCLDHVKADRKEIDITKYRRIPKTGNSD